MVFDALIGRLLIPLVCVVLGAVLALIVEQFVTRRTVTAHYGHTTGVDDSTYRFQQPRGAGRKKNESVKANTGSACTSRSRINSIGSSEGDAEFYDCSDNLSETGDSEPTKLLHEVDGLLRADAEQQQQALYLLEQNYSKYANEPEVLWRLAQASHAVAATVVNTERKKAIIQNGCEYGERAIKLNPSSSEAHKWYAINVGTRGQLSSNLSEQATCGRLYKEHIDEALKLKPNDGSLHHLLGRFNFLVASLSWMQRRMVSTFFSLPSVTVQDALNHFLKAEKLLGTPWKENRLFIARCHDTLGNIPATVEWLKKTVDAEYFSPGDEEAERTLRELSSKYSSQLGNRKKWV